MANPLFDTDPAAADVPETSPADGLEDELLLSVLFIPDGGPALEEIEALSEEELERLLIL